jgi:uncharacterized protein YjeT (DUF2065 family)
MRILLVFLSAFAGLNGLFLLLAPTLFYDLVPGVIETGPYNPHFLRDIGLGFLAAGLALGLAVRYPAASRPLIASASLFLAGHGLLHLVEMVEHGEDRAAAMRDILLIVLPGLLPLAALRNGAI